MNSFLFIIICQKWPWRSYTWIFWNMSTLSLGLLKHPKHGYSHDFFLGWSVRVHTSIFPKCKNYPFVLKLYNWGYSSNVNSAKNVMVLHVVFHVSVNFIQGLWNCKFSGFQVLMNSEGIFLNSTWKIQFLMIIISLFFRTQLNVEHFFGRCLKICRNEFDVRN